MTNEELKQKAQALPLEPGVYRMKDSYGSIIYIGKSKALKNRVSSYFNNSKKPTKVMRMVKQIDSFEVQYTETELDALILECRLIKHHQPIYNRLLKKDNKYRYLVIDPKEARPRIKMSREETDKGFCYGPYEKGKGLFEAELLLNHYYGLPDCKREEIKANCLTYKRNQCLAPCDENCDQVAFQARIKAACRFLEGEDDKIINDYKEQMAEAAANLDFERASELKEKWLVLEQLLYKREAMKLAASTKVTLLRLDCPRGGEQISVWVGVKLAMSKVMKRKPKGEHLNKLIENVQQAYEKVQREQFQKEQASVIKRTEVDEVQIIYSVMRRQPEECYESFEPSGDKHKDNETLAQALRQLIEKWQ